MTKRTITDTSAADPAGEIPHSSSQDARAPLLVPLEGLEIPAEVTIREVASRRVDALAELWDDPASVPPITIIEAENSRLLVDGHHRHRLAERKGWLALPAIVITAEPGEELFVQGRRLAYELASNGPLPLTATQKKEAADQLKRDSPTLSDREIGRILGVDHKTIANWRKPISSRAPSISVKGWLRDVARLPAGLDLATELGGWDDQIEAADVKQRLVTLTAPLASPAAAAAEAGER